jgi:gluconolactonase
MKLKTKCTIACSLLGLILVSSATAAAGQRTFRQPTPVKEVTVTAIPGVIAAGSEWTLVWQGTNNADGIVGTEEGGLLFAQEQPSTIGMLDPDDNYSIFASDTRGTGAVAIDSNGRVLGVERTCSDPGGVNPDTCDVLPELVVLWPTRETLASKVGDQTFWRMGEVIADAKGGAYFNDDTPGVYYINAAGEASLVAGPEVDTNGLAISPDEKTVYSTNRNTIVAFDAAPDGTTSDRRDFVTLQGGANGDGMCVDSEGRLYVSAGNTGIQVFSPAGEHLGIIPLPRSASSCAFSGPDKKVLYGKGAGMTGPDGQEVRTPEGVRNNAKAIYKINTIAQGFLGRPK